jgi:hypothetical protein
LHISVIRFFCKEVMVLSMWTKLWICFNSLHLFKDMSELMLFCPHVLIKMEQWIWNTSYMWVFGYECVDPCGSPCNF